MIKMTYEQETKQINENKKSGKASIRHEFKAAKWTFPNGHPRCLDCGQEESVSGFCEPTSGKELSKFDSWVQDRVKNQPNVKDLIKGQQGDWKKEGYMVSVDHDSTWSPKKGITEFHVVAHSPAGKPVGRYTFHHNGNSLKVSTADTDNLHQRKGLASEAYRLIEHHTGLKVQPDKIQSPEAEALWKQPNRPFGKSEYLEKGQHGDWQKEGYSFSHDVFNDKHETEHHISAYDKSGKIVAHFEFNQLNHSPDSLYIKTSEVHPDHQRKGIASAAYKMAEQKSNAKIVAEKNHQTQSAQLLWNQPNKPFGKSESDLLHLEHYSHQPSLDVIDPKFHGTGVKGEESRRKQNPDWVDRSYHYLAGTTPETTVGALPHKYMSQVPASKVYDYQKDPEKLKQKSMWGSSLDRNLYEKNIKDAGYHGYINHGAPGMGSVVALFHPVNVNKINKSEILVKKVDEKEFHSTIAAGASNVGNYSVDHLPHMNLADHHAQYIKDLHDPNTKLPSGLFDEGISPKLVHKMPYGTFMIKPFKEDGADTAGLATMTAKNAYDAGGIGHLNEDVSATMIHHPENPNFKIPVVVSKFQDHVTKTDQVPSTVVNPKESGQVMVMDYLLGNHDRHSANSLVNLSRKNEEGHYSPLAIDHAYSFNYGDEGLDYFIKNSASIGGFGKSAKLMNEKHRAELAGWYKNHGEKIHDAMQKSVDSVKDPNTKEYLRQNIKNRHDSLMKWANATGESYVSDIEPEHYSHPNEKGEGIMDDLSITPIQSKNDLDKLHEMYQKHLPSGYNRSMYMQMAAKKLHGISSEDLSDYFSEPVDHRSDFKNDLLATMVHNSGYNDHPNLKNIMIETLRKNKDHPDHAKPIYPFLQRTMEKTVGDKEEYDRKKAALDKLEAIKRK